MCIRDSLEELPRETQKNILDGVEKTKSNTGLNLILALSYGSRQELIRAIKRTFIRVKESSLEIDNIDETLLSSELYTADIPDPDLIIRTGGEYRLSNFLLWQIAYAELYFTNELRTEFNEDSLSMALESFNKRERRFGKTS
mgnify:CR=1 FL=1